MLKKVPTLILQCKYEDGLEEGIQADVNMLYPSSLYESISFSHDVEKKIQSLKKTQQASYSLSSSFVLILDMPFIASIQVIKTSSLHLGK